jgi:hypothetical protein
MVQVSWRVNGDEYHADGEAPYEGEAGLELSDLYLRVRPSWNIEGEWDWDVSISMEDANFGSEVFESGTETSVTLAQAACVEAAIGVVGTEGHLS